MINVVEDVLSGYGLRVLHVINFTEPVKAEELLALIPLEGRETATFYANIDRDLKMFHMHAAWKARELVDFSKIRLTEKGIASQIPLSQKPLGGAQFAPLAMTGTPPLRYGVLWYIAPGETMSLSIELAMDVYYEKLGRWPTVIWMRKRPEGAPEVYETVRNEVPAPSCEERDEVAGYARRKRNGAPRDCRASLAMTEAAWVPERFIVAGIPLEEYSPVWKDGKFVEVKQDEIPVPSAARSVAQRTSQDAKAAEVTGSARRKNQRRSEERLI